MKLTQPHLSTFVTVFILVLALGDRIFAVESINVLQVKSHRQLFLDGYIIDTLTGSIAPRLHEAVDRGQILRFDLPWEGRFSGYFTVIAHKDIYRLYYRGLDTSSEYTCYAESLDGIVWTKPLLGLHEFSGNKDNNIILSKEPTGVCHNFSPFFDTNPKALPSQQYKALGGNRNDLWAYCSPDGIHWQLMHPEPAYTEKGWVFDSQNVSFWSEAEQCYVLFYRKTPVKFRTVAKSTSPDFIKWSTGTMMKYSDTGTDAPSCHLYTNQTHPYFRAPQIYIATAARFFPGRQVLTDVQARNIGVHPQYFKDTSDSIIMTTRPDSIVYDKTFMSALIKPGVGPQNWVSRSNYPVLNIVPTSDTEMSLYINQGYAQPTNNLHRYAYRLDGIASMSADYKGGELVTRIFTFEGNNLSLNYATSAAGSIKIEIQDSAGNPIPGFTLNESKELIGNEIERTYDWNGNANLQQFEGKAIRLRFQMKDADLYSFIFTKAN
ncbi:MAG: hypothetical protein LLF76_12285 [Planctomycetaceae bacterium]|nr:hypothetical protein [Planctomycetaceae bacterium]